MSRYDPGKLDFCADTFSEEEFNHFFDEYYDKIYNTIYFKTGDPFTAEDLTEQVFEKLCSKLHQYDASKSSLNTWIYRIMHNSIIDYYRHKSYRQVAYFKEGEAEAIPDGSQCQADAAIIEGERSLEIARLLCELSEREHEILIMKFWTGLKNKEIAECLDMKPEAINVILFRALRKLAAIIEKGSFRL